MIIDNKAHARKGKSLVEFSAKTYFSYLAENSTFTFLLSKSVFCPLPFKMKWCGSSSCTAKV